MTLARAKKILSGRLAFADPSQIKAHEFLVSTYECIDHIRSCGKCSRYGECEKIWRADVEVAARTELGKRPLLYFAPPTTSAPSITLMF